MTFADIINRLTEDTQRSLPLFSPELCLVGTIVALLFVRLFDADRYLPASIVAIIGTVAGLVFACMQYRDFTSSLAPQSQQIFTGLLLYDPFTVFFRIFLLLFLVFVIYLTMISGIPDQEDAPDFYVLLLGSTLGMTLMASANHLLMIFLAVEMTSVPSYAMVGFLKGRKTSSEAALKYVVYGAGAAGVMLYGISLLAGLLGTAQLPTMAAALVEFGQHHHGFADPAIRTLTMGILMVLVGVAFKLSLFPFHFWCPDAFEGAAAEVGGFLSVASKGAAFALLVRFCLALVGPTMGDGDLSNLYLNVGVALGLVASVTATYGNLTAYGQSNIKRLLAYSTIAHAGIMLMAVSAMMVILNAPSSATASDFDRHVEAAKAVEGLLYYLSVYFFMNLGAFAVVAFIRNRTFSEEIDGYAGFWKQSPVLAVCMAVFVFSLIGMPPLGGFMAKFMIFASVVQAAEFSTTMWFVLAIGLANTVFALFYYLRILKAMFIAPLPPEAQPVTISADGTRYALLISIPVLLLGIIVDPIARAAGGVAAWLFQS